MTMTPLRLSQGAHSPDGEYCLMEHVSVRAGLPWSDRPACTHPALSAMARIVNDRLPDKPRQRLLQFEDRLMAAGDTSKAVSVGLALWSARQVQHLVSQPEEGQAEKNIGRAQAWLAEHHPRVTSPVDVDLSGSLEDGLIMLLGGLITEYERLTA